RNHAVHGKKGRVEMAVDWLADVRIYDADADEGVVDKIVKYCGIALQSRDGQLVAMSDKKERETVRENYLKKKLGLTHSDAELDEAVLSVGEIMKADRTKNRVTVYYLLARHFGALNIFGGVAGVAGAAAAVAGALSGDDENKDAGSAAPLAAAAGLAGAGVAAVTGAAAKAGDAVTGAVSGAAHVASDVASGAVDAVSGAASAATGAVTGAAGAVADAASAPLAAVRSGFDGDDNGGGVWGWLKWLLLALVLLALLFFLLRSCSGDEAQTTGDATTTEAVGGETADANADAAAGEADAAAAAVPEGAGVVASDVDGKPKLTVYFDSGKSAVTNDLTAAAANVKAYVDKNPTAKLAVSGYNDPTGNAEINARLSKERAQGVAKAIEAAGVPAASIELVKPEASTDATVDKAAARRVEVTVK
ncbi:DUF2853 family protein, partial [Sphingorhabdus sp.]|uniref:DUF2853 family protein n=3 Tax=Sphingorhabdus sp. TaxID=1902408 RepID=UPI003BB044ED